MRRSPSVVLSRLRCCTRSVCPLPPPAQQSSQPPVGWPQSPARLGSGAGQTGGNIFVDASGDVFPTARRTGGRPPRNSDSRLAAARLGPPRAASGARRRSRPLVWGLVAVLVDIHLN